MSDIERDATEITAVKPPASPLARAALIIAACALVGLVIVQSWQVLARYLLNASPGWTEPVTVLLLCTAMSMGAASSVESRAHFAFPLLAQRASATPRFLLAALSHLIVIGIGASLAIGAMVLLVDGWNIPLAGAPLPQSIHFLPLSLGGALMAWFALGHLITDWRSR